MVINIQFEEASDLLWELFKSLPEDKKPEFSRRVDMVSSCLCHPSNTDDDIVLSVSCDRTDKGAITLRGVVLPLEGLKVE